MCLLLTHSQIYVNFNDENVKTPFLIIIEKEEYDDLIYFEGEI